MSTSIYKLLSWMSPAYPVGSYAFSHGLENAIERGLVADEDDARQWIGDLLRYGNGFADLVFAAAAWDAVHDDELRELNDFVLAFQPSAELRLETTEQGRAFADVSGAAWPSAAVERLHESAPGELAYPIAIGVTAQAHDIRKEDLLTAFAHAFVSNLVSAAVRLVPLGQTAGQRLTSCLSGPCIAAIQRAKATGYQEVATSTIMADITSMNHETQYTRLFRS